MRSTEVSCLLQVAQEQGEDQDDGHHYQAAFAGGVAIIIFFVGAVLVEAIGVFFGGFVWEHGGTFGVSKLPINFDNLFYFRFYTNFVAILNKCLHPPGGVY